MKNIRVPKILLLIIALLLAACFESEYPSIRRPETTSTVIEIPNSLPYQLHAMFSYEGDVPFRIVSPIVLLKGKGDEKITLRYDSSDESYYAFISKDDMLDAYPLQVVMLLEGDIEVIGTLEDKPYDYGELSKSIRSVLKTIDARANQ